MNRKKISLLSVVLLGSLICMQGCLGERSGVEGVFDLEYALTKKNIVPILVIGSGPAGLAAGLYGARARMGTLVIEGNKPGGLLMETSYVENWPGFKRILGREAIGNLKEQATSFGAQFLSDSVESVDFSSWPYEVKTEDGLTLSALSVIVATGAAPRTLGVPGEQDYWGRGVTTCAVCDAPFYKDQDVVVVGGGDSAVEEALQVAQYAKNVTILVRKDHMRASPSMQERIEPYDSIKVLYNVQVQRVRGNEHHVTGIALYNNKTQEVTDMPIDGIFLAIGHEPTSQVFADYLERDANGYLVMDGRTQQTSLPGVFAAGEVEDHRYRQAGVAAGQGICASLDAENFLREIGFNAIIAEQLDQFSVSHKRSQSFVRSITTLAEFEQVIAESEGPVIFDFYTDTCPSCLGMMPAFESVAEQYAEQATLIKIDADEAVGIIERLGIRKVPALLLFKDGQLVSRHNMAMNRAELIELVQSSLN